MEGVKKSPASLSCLKIRGVVNPVSTGETIYVLTQTTMTNTNDEIMLQLETLLKDATQQLKKFRKEDNPDAPAATIQEMSIRSLQMRGKSTQMEHQILEELVIAAYYNINNPDWDPARPETYWTELAEDDPLRQLLNA